VADLAAGEEDVERVLCGVPGHVRAHEVAVAHALLVGSLAECGVRDVARANVGQVEERAGLVHVRHWRLRHVIIRVVLSHGCGGEGPG
jgi:hypothetical protein